MIKVAFTGAPDSGKTTLAKMVYTDCPIMLSYIYAIDLVEDAKDLRMLTELYEETLTLLGRNVATGLRDSLQIPKPRYDLIFLLRPFRETVKDDVRAQDWNRIGRLNTQVQSFLDLHGLPYTELISDVDMDMRVAIVEKAVEKVYLDTEAYMKKMLEDLDRLRVG